MIPCKDIGGLDLQTTFISYPLHGLHVDNIPPSEFLGTHLSICHPRHGTRAKLMSLGPIELLNDPNLYQAASEGPIPWGISRGKNLPPCHPSSPSKYGLKVQ